MPRTDDGVGVGLIDAQQRSGRELAAGLTHHLVSFPGDLVGEAGNTIEGC